VLVSLPEFFMFVDPWLILSTNNAPASAVSIVTRQEQERANSPAHPKTVRPKLYFCCAVYKRGDIPHRN